MQISLATFIINILVVLGGGASVMMSLWNEYTENILILQLKVEQLEKNIALRTDDRWRKTDQVVWAAELKHRNPQIKIPLISDKSPTAADYDQ